MKTWVVTFLAKLLVKPMNRISAIALACLCLCSCTVANYPNGQPALTTPGGVKGLSVHPANGVTAEEITSPLEGVIRTLGTLGFGMGLGGFR